jgi:pyruvate formate lyase activating enzyme
MIKGSVFNIQKFAIHDGPGIRIVIFLFGCPLSCWWCHNPESQGTCNAVTFAKNNSSNKHLISKEITVNHVMEEIEKEIIYFDESGGGVTFSGGEPLMQPDFLKILLKECKKREIHTALDTTGYSSEEAFNSVIDDVDLFLFDLKLINDDLHKQYTGVSNQIIHKNLETLARMGKKTIIRFPVIPDITDTKDNLLAIKKYLLSLKTIKDINLLPYHKTTESKYIKLNRKYKLSGMNPPGENKMILLKNEFEEYGFKVKIGG